MSDATLEKFFTRPVKLGSFVWSVNSSFFQTFNPYTLFFQNPRVINRICNFNLMRAKMKIKIMINGNSFLYGRLIASFLPHHTGDSFTLNRAFFSQDIIAASQRPHVYLDPNTCQGGTLCLPFCWYLNAWSIPDQSWNNMGTLNIRSLQDLKHANGGATNVTVSVFAWLEDVNISIPTANAPGALSPQMGDEYGQGVISRPAGTVAKVAGALARYPPLAPYAQATQMAASTVSSIAQMFGFARPTVIDDTRPYKPVYMGNMTATTGSDTSTKLTLDMKQETTVDSRVMGLGGDDEMNLRSIATRESYLTQFPWSTATGAEVLLWNSEVSPVLWARNSAEYHWPACAFSTLPFKRWRGTMKFRFQVVCSSFHRGRIKVTWDPSYPLTNEYNTNYTHIVDLAGERDFTISIGWGSPYAMLGYRDPGIAALPYGTTPLGAAPGEFGNGIVSVYVVNELTSAYSADTIGVNVFVSMGDDYEVYEPTSDYIGDMVFFPTPEPPPLAPQMGEPLDATPQENAPMGAMMDVVKGPSLDFNDMTDMVYYGDPIVSFRQCLKRYCYSMSWVPESVANSYYRVVTPTFPAYRGYAPGAMFITAMFQPYNYTKMTLLNWVTPAYVCRRGGIRWKYLRTGASTDDVMYTSRHSDGGTAAYTWTTRSDMGPSLDFRTRQATMAMLSTWDGVTITPSQHNNVLEAEYPWYHNVRFGHARDSSPNTPTFPLPLQNHSVCGTWSLVINSSPVIHSYVATAEDFNLAFFVGCPVTYHQPHAFDPLTF